MRISRCELVADMRMRLARTALPTGVVGALTQGAGMRNVFGGRLVSAGAMCQRPQCAGWRTVSAATRLSCCKVSADTKCRQAQCVDRRAVPVCKLCRRSQGAGGLKAPGAAPCRRAHEVAGRKVSPGAMSRQGAMPRRAQCDGGCKVCAGALCRRAQCAGGHTVSAGAMCRLAQCGGGRVGPACAARWRWHCLGGRQVQLERVAGCLLPTTQWPLRSAPPPSRQPHHHLPISPQRTHSGVARACAACRGRMALHGYVQPTCCLPSSTRLALVVGAARSQSGVWVEAPPRIALREAVWGRSLGHGVARGPRIVVWRSPHTVSIALASSFTTQCARWPLAAASHTTMPGASTK